MTLDAELAPFLEPTDFVDSTHPSIVRCAEALTSRNHPPVERAVTCFYFVRDQVEYDFLAKLRREEYVASHVLAVGRGFCVQKAILLCALGRAVRVPTGLVLSDLRDATLPERLARALGTDVMVQHGLNAFHLDGTWRRADASLSPTVVRKKRCPPVDFDGTADALAAPTTLDGEPYAEYLAFHGTYADLPFDSMLAAFFDAYKNADLAALKAMGYSINPPSDPRSGPSGT